MQRSTIFSYRLFIVCSVIMLLLVTLYRMRADRANAERAHAISERVSNNSKMISRIRDAKTGEETVKVTTLDIPYSQIQELLNTSNQQWEARLVQQLRAQEGRFARMLLAQRVRSTTTAGFKTTVRDTVVRRILIQKNGRIDTVFVKAKSAVYQDQWLTFKGVIEDDTMKTSYTVRNEQHITAYSKRVPWWNLFKRRAIFVNLKNLNPNTTTDSLHVMVVQPRRKFLGLF